MIIIFHTFLFNCLIELLTNFDKNIWKLLEWDYFFSIVVVARHSFVNVHLMIIMMGIANKNNEFDDRTDRPLLSLGTIHILHQKRTGWVVSKMFFFLTFSTVLFMLISHFYWVGRSGKVQKCADVICGWSLTAAAPSWLSI